MVQLRKREEVSWLKEWIIRFVYSKESCKENQLEQRRNCRVTFETNGQVTTTYGSLF